MSPSQLKTRLEERYLCDLTLDDFFLVVNAGAFEKIVSECGIKPALWHQAVPSDLRKHWRQFSMNERCPIVATAKALTPIPDTDAPTPFNERWRTQIDAMPKTRIIDMLRAVLIHNADRDHRVSDIRREAFIQGQKVTTDDLKWMIARLHSQWRNDPSKKQTYAQFEDSLRRIFRETAAKLPKRRKPSTKKAR